MNESQLIYQVDAFSNRPFSGNPAGVLFIDSTYSAQWMQNIAMEMNLSETAFVIPHNSGFRIRFFTPTKEVPLCGHATLASAHIIYELGFKARHETIEFQSGAGPLSVSSKGDWIVMDFPTYSVNRIDTPPFFFESVGFNPIEMYSSEYGWLVAVASSETEIAKATPNMASLLAHDLGHLMITAAGDSSKADFVVRCFAPISGIDEDPVTGSAHCALTPIWANKLNKKELRSMQISQRTGELKLTLLDDNRLLIAGQAVTVFSAELKV